MDKPKIEIVDPTSEEGLKCLLSEEFREAVERFLEQRREKSEKDRPFDGPAQHREE